MRGEVKDKEEEKGEWGRKGDRGQGREIDGGRGRRPREEGKMTNEK